MKEERTAGPLHSAHCMQLHSPRHAAPPLPPAPCPPRLFDSHSPPVNAILTAPRGVCPPPSTGDVLRSLGPGWPI
ncbi:hypothetical protein PBY51_019923 [Eleginops maclovinus]|uniref:Uncharacterized protein n=1 Tax=Eleginops maclovinus TaxID=56733 RepID=A0AAN7XRR3_ELEMC|nr:hypothetical protein PBY51_019923 [Eleginops maclovinus]